LPLPTQASQSTQLGSGLVESSRIESNRIAACQRVGRPGVQRRPDHASGSSAAGLLPLHDGSRTSSLFCRITSVLGPARLSTPPGRLAGPLSCPLTSSHRHRDGDGASEPRGPSRRLSVPESTVALGCTAKGPATSARGGRLGSAGGLRGGSALSRAPGRRPPPGAERAARGARCRSPTRLTVVCNTPVTPRHACHGATAAECQWHLRGRASRGAAPAQCSGCHLGRPGARHWQVAGSYNPVAPAGADPRHRLARRRLPPPRPLSVCSEPPKT
jgi:hypothetical protein